MTADSEPLKVFVYGTLKPGHVNYRRYCTGRVLKEEAAMARGCLYDLAAGYPVMTVGEGWVVGVLLWFKQHQVLGQLDRLEGYQPGRPAHQNLYDRQLIEVFDPAQMSLGTAWTYLMAPETVRLLQGRRLAAGRWG